MELPEGTLVPLLILGAAVAVLALIVIGLRTRQGRGGRVIRVVGIGSGGANAVETMIRAGMKGVDYVVVNTDHSVLRRSSAGTKIEIGKSITKGLGTGGDSSLGEAAAREAVDEIGRALAGADLVVITAGLGGGTGSGAAPVVAEVARRQGALTMAVVTKPFGFEGARRQHVAQGAAAALVDKVDAVATIPNDRVREVVHADVTVEDAFRAIDEVLRRTVGEIVDLIAVPGRINLDFADVRAVLQGGGAAVVGLGRAAGENRAVEAARRAMATLHEAPMEGATSIIVNVSGTRRLKLAELDAVADTVRAAAGRDANIVFGMSLQRRLRDEVQVTLIATGFEPGRSAGGRAAAGNANDPAWRPVWLRRSTEPEPQPMPESARSSATAALSPTPKPAPTAQPAVTTEATETKESRETTEPTTTEPATTEPATTVAPQPTPGSTSAARSRRAKRAAERERRAAQSAGDVTLGPDRQNGLSTPE